MKNCPRCNQDKPKFRSGVVYCSDCAKHRANGHYVLWDYKEAAQRINNNIQTSRNGCWIYQGSKHTQGYGLINIGKKKMFTHRIVAILKYKRLLNGRSDVVMHTCDNPPCVNPAHLKIGTQKDNVRDSIKKGRANRASGEKSGRSILNKDQVVIIRKSYKSGISAGDLAKLCGTSLTNIYHIIRNKTWVS